jgi:hypothetical protein
MAKQKKDPKYSRLNYGIWDEKEEDGEKIPGPRFNYKRETVETQLRRLVTVGSTRSAWGISSDI